MRKRAIFGLATILAATPLALAPAQAAGVSIQHARQAPRAAQNDHRWRKGERFDRKRADHYAVVDYRKYRGLRTPPRGYHWVRSGNDAVLVAISSGVIASVIANAIR
ncbi:RcnB family protein [Sphingomonas sp. MMS12-HWE2-04]|uniref:RcnB family protein n=1 Tax=Sphingomonas sp. MMS12-HWE2-04 TaxID=3234199 RepID=UPI0038504A3D